MSAYAWAHIVHLFCALLFVGGVLFEALILAAIHSRDVSHEARREVEQAIKRRAVRVMPPVVALLFVSGLTMAWLRYLPLLASPLASSFSLQLTLKIVLAFSVLLHFVLAVSKIRRGTLNRAWSRYIHRAVLLQMLAIVLLAKTMFYIAW